MDGLIVVDKDKDMTSRDVVDIVCKTLKRKDVGHTGTLDPNATGVLVICVGKALKLVEDLTSEEKTYIGEAIIGYTTDTLDVTGNILEEKEVSDLSKDDITQVLNSFIGKYNQEVPLYSSIKVGGKKLYEYARRGEAVVLPKREVLIKEIKLVSDIFFSANSISFYIEVTVSKGTYIRSLMRDIGAKLGYPACMGNLRRIKQGVFNVDNANKIVDIKNNNIKYLAIDEVLADMPVIIADSELERKIKNAMIINRLSEEDKCLIKDQNNNLLAIYHTYSKDLEKMKPYKMFI